jgi:hypothetical protein
VSDPANTVLLGTVNTLVSKPAIVGNAAYLPRGSSGIAAYDVSNAANPVFLGATDTPGNSIQLQIIGDLAYVADSIGGMQIIDVSDCIPCPADIAAPAGTVNVNDLFLLLANWNSNGPGANLAAPTTIVDVSDLFVMLAAWGDCP